MFDARSRLDRTGQAIGKDSMFKIRTWGSAPESRYSTDRLIWIVRAEYGNQTEGISLPSA